jgi:hypothetical protein
MATRVKCIGVVGTGAEAPEPPAPPFNRGM